MSTKMRSHLVGVIDATDKLTDASELFFMLTEELQKPEINLIRLQLLADAFAVLYKQNLAELRSETLELDRFISRT